MEKETVILEKPVSSAGLTITVVAKLRLGSWKHAAFGMKQPVAVVVDSAAGKTVFSVTTGEAITMQQLAREFPTIKGELEKLARS